MRLLAAVAAFVAVVTALAFVVLRGTTGAGFPTLPLDAARARPQGDVYRSPVTEPPTLNPFTTTDAVAAFSVLPFTHDTLVDRDPVTGAVRPAAAASWRLSEDARTLTFRLRDDLVFADGARVTTADIAFTLDTARDARLAPRSQMATVLGDVTAARVTDDGAIELTLAEPRASAVLALGGQLRIAERRFFVDAVRALDPSATEPTSDAFFAKLPEVVRCGPGTGAYAEQRVVAGTEGWVPGSHLNLVQNPHSWRRRAQPESWNLAGLQLRFVVDEASKLAALRRGEVDWFVSQAGADLAKLLAGDAELARRFVRHGYDPHHLGHYFVLWNCRRAPLDDPEVRFALSLLFDRAAIVRDVFGGRAYVAKGYFKPGMPEYPDELPDPVFSIAEARARLAAKGLGGDGKPLRIELLCASELPTLRQIGEIAARASRAAGVELVPVPMEYGSIYARQVDHDFDGIVWLQMHEPVIDPYDFFASEWNDMGYVKPEMDDVLKRARAATDEAERVALYHRFQAILHDEQPITLLVHPSVEVLVDRRFHDAAPGPLGLFPERFWVPPEEQVVR